MAHQARNARIERRTNETQVTLAVSLDGSGQVKINSGVGFLDHMLDLLGRHANLDLEITAKGDTHIDDHHSVEDIGIVLGQALREALGDKAGIRRYGAVYLPMDEALSRVVVDLSNRPYLVWHTDFPSQKIGRFDTELVREFFQAFASAAGATLHVETLYGANSHHIAESCFKGLGRALRDAIAPDPAMAGRIPSTKGTL